MSGKGLLSTYNLSCGPPAPKPQLPKRDERTLGEKWGDERWGPVFKPPKDKTAHDVLVANEDDGA
jgi:hypothetical protein